MFKKAYVLDHNVLEGPMHGTRYKCTREGLHVFASSHMKCTSSNCANKHVDKLFSPHLILAARRLKMHILFFNSVDNYLSIYLKCGLQDILHYQVILVGPVIFNP